jgi:hypothetical protein
MARWSERGYQNINLGAECICVFVRQLMKLRAWEMVSAEITCLCVKIQISKILRWLRDEVIGSIAV